MTATEAVEPSEIPEIPAMADVVTAVHEHALRLVAVHLEDGSSTREFCCETCPAVWFS